MGELDRLYLWILIWMGVSIMRMLFGLHVSYIVVIQMIYLYVLHARSICLFVCLFVNLFVCLFVCQHFVDSSVCGTMACHWMYQFISALGLQWSQHRIGLRICALIARLYRTRWQVTWVICKTWELLVWDWMLLNTFQEKTWQRSLRRSVCSKASTVGFSHTPDIVL